MKATFSKSHRAHSRIGAGTARPRGLLTTDKNVGTSSPRPGVRAGLNPPCKPRRMAGIFLTECLVYLAIFALLTGIGLAAFYLCWNHSQALVYATDDISAALRAGERWRADVRRATGRISLEPSATGEWMRIPEGERTIVYLFEAGEVRRELLASQTSELLLPRVKTSQMSVAARSGVTAWRWELELNARRPETQLPLLFTFEAVQTKP